MHLAGVDGCRGGWVLARVAVSASGALRVEEIGVLATFAALLRRARGCALVGLDMPIGLLDVAQRGGRACDRAARTRLGSRRGACVFSPPVRAALRAHDFPAALALNRASSPERVGLSIQTYCLFEKLREVDATLSPTRQRRIKEVHPELSFVAMNDEFALPPKKSNEGFLARRALLERAGLTLPRTPPGAQPDDVLDALAVAWSAARIARGLGERLPQEPSRDRRGLEMEIRF